MRSPETNMPNKESHVPQLVAVTDLGPNNLGSISCQGLSPSQKQQEIKRVLSPERYKTPTQRFRCVDGRRPMSDLRWLEGQADPQIAGGLAISETAADMMVESHQHMPKSKLVAHNTSLAVQDGLDVVIHGDTHKGKSGCGANVLIRPTLQYNAENIEVVLPTAWFLGQQLGLDRYTSEKDVHWLIGNGKRNGGLEDLWDADPEQTVDIALKNGAEYEELAGDHNETAIVVNTDETATDAPDAFVASLGAYQKQLFQRSLARGKSEREAALRMMAVVLFNVGIPKQLTAEEKGHGEALPVVVVGPTR